MEFAEDWDRAVAILVQADTSKPMAWTFAGDEAGDTSFRFDRGATRYLVFAIIGTQRPEALRQALALLRQQYNLPAHYEFGFHATTARKLRAALFDTVAGLDFRIWAVVAEKEHLHNSFKVMPARSFYVYMVAQTIGTIRLDWRENATLLLDEFDRSGKALAELKKTLKLLSLRRGFAHIHSRRSYSDSLVQIADLAAGAILRRYAGQDDSAHRRFEPKIESLLQVGR